MLEATQGMCFACGPNNSIGLKMAFHEEGDAYVGVFHPRPEHQGYDDIVHGGLISTALDEVMARWLWAKGLPFATAELTVRYRAPLRVGRTLTVTARIEKESARLIEMTADGVDSEGVTVATAKGRFLPVKGLRE